MTEIESQNSTKAKLTTNPANSIPISRAILYFLILGFIPLFSVFLHYSAKNALQQSLNGRLSEACFQVANQNLKARYSTLTRKLFQDKDHFYIERQVGSITPLSSEIGALQKVLSSGFHPDEEAMKRRLSLLTGPENKLTFTESAEKSYAGLKETVNQLSRSVEVDVQDIRKILARVEGVQIGQEGTQECAVKARPHLIVTDFKIDKKKGFLGDVYSLQLKILKREYTK